LTPTTNLPESRISAGTVAAIESTFGAVTAVLDDAPPAAGPESFSVFLAHPASARVPTSPHTVAARHQ
jgi:hypothetical protein